MSGGSEMRGPQRLPEYYVSEDECLHEAGIHPESPITEQSTRDGSIEDGGGDDAAWFAARLTDLTHAAAVGSAATKSQQSLANKLFASLFRDTHSTGSLAVAENAFAYLIMVDGPSALKESAWWKSSSCFHFLERSKQPF